MEHLDFLSPDLAAADAAWSSPLERALADAPAGIEDLSRTGVLDVRGELDGLDAGDADVIRLTPERTLVLCPFEDTARLRSRLAGARRLVVDVSTGWAGLSVGDEAVLRRLTDLDLERLPAVGSVAHVRTILIRPDNETFRLYFPQEYADYVAEALIDATQGPTA
jgi:sarcosine oxidase gamma subunit